MGVGSEWEVNRGSKRGGHRLMPSSLHIESGSGS